MSHFPVYEARHTPILLEVVREHIRAKHYSRRTEQSYTGWIHWYVMCHGNRHPRDMEGSEVEAFLTDLAVNGKVSATTQTQALSAFLFLYREVLGTDLPWLDYLVRAKPCRRLRLYGVLLTFVSGYCGGHQGPVMAETCTMTMACRFDGQSATHCRHPPFSSHPDPSKGEPFNGGDRRRRPGSGVGRVGPSGAGMLHGSGGLTSRLPVARRHHLGSHSGSGTRLGIGIALELGVREGVERTIGTIVKV